MPRSVIPRRIQRVRNRSRTETVRWLTKTVNPPRNPTASDEACRLSVSIDKKRTCLVVIDLQKGITAMPTQPYDTKSVIDNASKLANAFRQNQMPVFLVHVTASPGTTLNIIFKTSPSDSLNLTLSWSVTLRLLFEVS